MRYILPADARQAHSRYRAIVAHPTPAPDLARRAADDIELAVALTEYQKIIEMRRAVSDQAHNRYNFFLVIATAVAAVSAGLVGSNIDPEVRIGAVAALAALMLLMGPAVFLRQLRFTGTSHRYGLAEQALRSYLVRRAPQVAPYVLLPTLDDPGLFLPTATGGRQRQREAVGLAASIGLVNSALLAAGGGLALSALDIDGWALVLLDVALFAAAAAVHLWWVSRTVRRDAAERERLLAARALDVLDLFPPVVPPSPSPEPDPALAEAAEVAKA
ncbi:hypothetical protein GCM10009662_45370 [Catellatospora coxensis]|uniref:Uncharacterized protein n=1 Tax=Catellatospora coxensis TaxID=310354 RepID=A0A8J3L7V2_9ACTN|nr:hypothetical protein Cco03nite_46050 [Catellatospora coxensis]